MQHIAPCLWFDNQAEEAAHFYTSIFKNSKILRLRYYGDAGAEVSGKPKGSLMTVTFQLEGQQFIALNGGLTSSSRRPSLYSSVVRARRK